MYLEILCRPDFEYPIPSIDTAGWGWALWLCMFLKISGNANDVTLSLTLGKGMKIPFKTLNSETPNSDH